MVLCSMYFELFNKHQVSALTGRSRDLGCRVEEMMKVQHLLQVKKKKRKKHEGWCGERTHISIHQPSDRWRDKRLMQTQAEYTLMFQWEECQISELCGFGNIHTNFNS